MLTKVRVRSRDREIFKFFSIIIIMLETVPKLSLHSVMVTVSTV